MSKNSDIDYSIFDRPEILSFLFYPRKEGFFSQSEGSNNDVLIPVEDDVVVGGRFHIADKSAPNILFFHGNGEIVSDYDELGPVYVSMGVNFLPVDYRGYGRSTGMPTVSAMMDDCHTIFEYVQAWLKEKEHTGPFIVMGRSLGSISALELASNYRDRIDGIVIESGLAYAIPLLRLLGIDVRNLGISEDHGFNNIEKIKTFDKITLVIHAEFDHIIPFSDGQALYDASPAPDKRFLMIPGANHNDIFVRGFQDYMYAIKDFLGAVE
jgi:pimeloyl-ACP methyl ester carboxylesterase